VPFEYVQQLESVSNAAPNPGVHIYAAPVLFEQDASAVPGIVRATDYMWSALAAQNLNSWFGVGFPISNYRCVKRSVNTAAQCCAVHVRVHVRRAKGECGRGWERTVRTWARWCQAQKWDRGSCGFAETRAVQV
jgi:hypothetical protein